MLVKYLWVEGEGAAEFADLAGTAGELRPNGSGHGWTYIASGKDSFLQMTTMGPEEDSDGRLRVKTALGNVFVFRRLGDGN